MENKTQYLTKIQVRQTRSLKDENGFMSQGFYLHGGFDIGYDVTNEKIHVRNWTGGNDLLNKLQSSDLFFSNSGLHIEIRGESLELV